MYSHCLIVPPVAPVPSPQIQRSKEVAVIVDAFKGSWEIFDPVFFSSSKKVFIENTKNAVLTNSLMFEKYIYYL